MKKLIFLFWIALFYCFSAQADEFDDFLAKLETYRDGLSRQYKSVIKSQHELNVNKYFAITSIDHRSLAIGIHMKAREDFRRVSEIAQKFETLKYELSQYPERVNELSVQFFNLHSEAKRRLILSNHYMDDLRIIQDSWDTYCNEARLNNLDRFFKPLSNFAPDQDIGFLSAPKSPNGIRADASFSMNGEMNSFYSTNTPGTTEEENEKWMQAAGIVAVAAGAVCAAFTVGLGAQACATIGFFAVMAIKFISDLVRFAGDNEKYAKRVNKQSAIRQQIYDIQINSIRELEVETQELVKKTCEERFVKGETWPIQEVTKLIEETKVTNQSIEDFVHGDLATIKEDHYDYLINSYFPNLVQEFLSSIKTYYIDRPAINEEVKNFLNEKVVDHLKSLNASETYTQKVFWQQKLWTDVIQGDSEFLEDDEFSFVKIMDSTANPQFSNIWLQAGPEVLKRAAQ